MLINIFLYLDFYDIQAARLCCKQWFYISNCCEFVSKRRFTITEGVLDREHPAAEVISNSKIGNLYLEGIEFGDVGELFGQIGANLKVLTLQFVGFVNFVEDHLLAFTHFTNLQSLKVWGFDYDIFPNDCQYQPFVDLSRLKELELTFNVSRVNKYLLRCSLRADFLEKLILDFDKELEVEVLKMLDKQTETLKILDLTYCEGHNSEIVASQWKRIGSKLSLKELSLDNGFSCDIVIEMVKNQKSLRTLHLRQSNNVDDGHLTLIAQKLPQLERLFLNDCDQVTDIGVVQLAKLSKLTVLNLRRCLKVTSAGIRSIIGKEANTQLQELHMKQLFSVTDDAICCCAKNLKNLRVLDLCFCNIAVTDKSINDIFEYQSNLRDLSLDKCTYLTDFGILGRSSIRKLEKLERLKLCDCYQLTDETLCGVRAPHLKFLDIRGCLKMTGRGISALAKNSPAIEKIAFTYSKEMNEEVVDVLTKSLSRLKTLTIQDCSEELKQGTTNWKLSDFNYGLAEVLLRRRA